MLTCLCVVRTRPRRVHIVFPRVGQSCIDMVLLFVVYGLKWNLKMLVPMYSLIILIVTCEPI